jgi:hypothetical protein
LTDYTKNLLLDRRLARRRGWITPEQLDSALEELPDVSNSIAPPEDPSSEASPEPSADPTAGA